VSEGHSGLNHFLNEQKAGIRYQRRPGVRYQRKYLSLPHQGENFGEALILIVFMKTDKLPRKTKMRFQLPRPAGIFAQDVVDSSKDFDSPEGKVF
jgi:hypothetical protein